MDNKPVDEQPKVKNHYRFHLPHKHLSATFGNDWFSLKAEAFARFFGTPFFLLAQTGIVVFWIVINELGLTRFDAYPFILLNLAFSLQAAYAAPLILLAQTRQAERDKVHSEADAKHREHIAAESEKREHQIVAQTSQLIELLKQNTELTELTKKLAERVESLTMEVHNKIVADKNLK